MTRTRMNPDAVPRFFRIRKDRRSVRKKWAGIGKEFFTSADNYMISLNEDRSFQAESAPLLLAAGLAIDTVYKEK